MATKANIVLMPGDGVGPEIVAQAVKAMNAVAAKYDVAFKTTEVAIGGAAIDAHGVPLRPEDLAICKKADAVLLGAVGGPAWDNIEVALRPERGLLALRKGMGLFANLRPVAVNDVLAHTSPIKTEIVSGTDLVVVRELTGGIYFGKPSGQRTTSKGRAAVDTMRYREDEIARVVRLAFELARTRRKQLASVDKMNVLATSRLWRSIVEEIAPNYPDVTLEHVLVDAMAMRLVRQPSRFDVVVMENMFGDILTDEASVLAGSIGLLPSASVGATRGATDNRRRGLYEPIHGSAPSMAGQGKANPVGTILSFAMLLRSSLGLDDAARDIENAVEATIEAGIRTYDIAGDLTPVSTDAFGDEVAKRI
ncbi:MAG: 3-isopropylmalate dehydrogenase [Thermomicrobiales bacterium]|nr:3-isopropylmalate dehydrogenase [Thermomicrobiales bacterium]